MRADLSAEPLERLLADMDKLETTIAKEVTSNALVAGGKIAAEYLEGSITEKGLIDTGDLVRSMKATVPKADKSGQMYTEVYPHGTHHTYKARTASGGGTKKRYQHEKGAEVKVPAAEVGFILEYGTKKMPATHWMSEAADAGADDITQAMADELTVAINENLGG